VGEHHLLGICGALRTGSSNRLLLRGAARFYAPDSYTEADLRFPLYDGDLEDAEGIPDAVQVLADQILAADAIIISTPEYNAALSGVLKNALDWVSRVKGAVWKGKPVAIMSAAAGRAGGARPQVTLRHAMTPFNPRILQGPEVMLAASRSAFDGQGNFLEERVEKGVASLMAALRAEVEVLR
jgi:chromate reductase